MLLSRRDLLDLALRASALPGAAEFFSAWLRAATDSQHAAATNAFAPPAEDLPSVLARLDLQLTFQRLSPISLYSEVVQVILTPTVRSLQRNAQEQLLAQLGLVMVERGAVQGAPLPLVQSLLIVWAQIVSLVAATILLFVAGYVTFQRQEIGRASCRERV